MIRPARGEISGRYVIIWDVEEANRVYFSGFYGKPMNVKKPKGPFNEPLILDPIESLYLLEKQRLEIYSDGRRLSFSEAFRLFSQGYEDLETKYEFYRLLRDAGYVVLPGIKFGGDFAIYKKGPGLEHAPFIMKITARNRSLSVADVVLAGRLARSVRKKYIFAVSAKPPVLIGLEWWKP
ncbi:MAG: tRNA-intron lyase [Nitrososphaeria archaeon]